jgi:hypothetical protein
MLFVVFFCLMLLLASPQFLAMDLIPAVINDEDSAAPLPPRPQWRTVESIIDTGVAESRATLNVLTDAGISCVKGAIKLQRYGDHLLFRLGYEGYDAPNNQINYEKTRKGCVYLPADDLVEWNIQMNIEEKSSGFDVQQIRMQFGSGVLCADGRLSITITIILSDDNDERFYAALTSADEERRHILNAR